MYHSVETTQLEQHTPRFLWRDMDARKEPDTYHHTVVLTW